MIARRMVSGFMQPFKGICYNKPERQMSYRMLSFSPILAAVPGSAHAHVGHVGELAGHAHWIALAAGVIAAAAAAAITKQQIKENKNADDTDSKAEPESEAEGAPA